ncbi:MAG: hypothetical protein ACLVJ6_06320 [Merdibacter sp.]
MNDCLRCMKPCDPSHTPYCISEALITSVSRDAQDGVVFVGANAWRIDSLLHVSQLLTQLKEEANASRRRTEMKIGFLFAGQVRSIPAWEKTFGTL